MVQATVQNFGGVAVPDVKPLGQALVAIGQERADATAASELDELTSQVVRGRLDDPVTQENLAKLSSRDPQRGEALAGFLQSASAAELQGAENAAALDGRLMRVALNASDPEKAVRKLIKQDSEEFGDLVGLEGDDLQLAIMNKIALNKDAFDAVQAAKKTAAISASDAGFNELIANLPPEEQERARRIRAGVAPRAVGSAAITIAGDEGDLAEDVADTQAIIKERAKFAEKTGESRAKAIDSGFEKIQGIDKNVRNVNRAIQAIDEGASTGAIESRFFPSVRAASVALDQIQGELALDVVGAVTFGALSQGELDLAREVALPKNLDPPELREFLQNKLAAQEKLRAYYVSQIDFLDQGGSIAGFLRNQGRQGGQQQEQPGQPAEQPAEIPTATGPNGEKIQFINGQWVLANG